MLDDLSSSDDLTCEHFNQLRHAYLKERSENIEQKLALKNLAKVVRNELYRQDMSNQLMIQTSPHIFIKSLTSILVPDTNENVVILCAIQIEQSWFLIDPRNLHLSEFQNSSFDSAFKLLTVGCICPLVELISRSSINQLFCSINTNEFQNIFDSLAVSVNKECIWILYDTDNTSRGTELSTNNNRLHTHVQIIY